MYHDCYDVMTPAIVALINGYQCAPKAFQCAINHKCIPYEKRCDVEVDCEDQSDERGCCE